MDAFLPLPGYAGGDQWQPLPVQGIGQAAVKEGTKTFIGLARALRTILD